MNVFIFESITAGSSLRTSDHHRHASLLDEGRAMVSAVASDFASSPDVESWVLWDSRLGAGLPAPIRSTRIDCGSSLTREFDRLCESCDAVVVIAPELDGELIDWTERAESRAVNVISATRTFAGTAGDKWETWRRLKESGIATPTTQLATEFVRHSSLAPPYVVKRRDGAGGQEATLLHSREEVIAYLSAADTSARIVPDRFVVQEFHRGIPVSVSMLVCDQRRTVFPPAFQQLTNPPELSFCGATWPIGETLAPRAIRAAERALDALPGARGFVGVDLILDERDLVDGDVVHGDIVHGDIDRCDLVIEINPRVTSTYLGLREMLCPSIASMWLRMQQGFEVDYQVELATYEFQLSHFANPCSAMDQNPTAGERVPL